MPQALYIFEERYKQMVAWCVRENLPFGIVLSSADETVTMGCLARIVRIERLPEGRMNIEVVGEERFRILSTHDALPYRSAWVVPTRDESDTDPVLLHALAADVQKLLRDFLTRRIGLSGQTAHEFELPTDPELLSYLAGWVLPLDSDEKQILLEERSAASRLAHERDLLREVVLRLRRTEEAAHAAQVWEKMELRRFADVLCPN